MVERGDAIFLNLKMIHKLIENNYKLQVITSNNLKCPNKQDYKYKMNDKKWTLNSKND